MKAMAELGPGLGSPGSGPPGSVSLAVSSSLSAFSSLRRYGTELSIGELKVGPKGVWGPSGGPDRA